MLKTRIIGGIAGAALVGASLAAAIPWVDESAHHPFEQSPESDDPVPVADPRAPAGAPQPAGGGVLTPAVQPSGALKDRIVYTSGGHGWTWGGSSWETQRGVTQQMNEDQGNLDQVTLFADYCFQAGATVVALRPVGFQTNEVVLDNTSPGVTFGGAWSDSSATVYFGRSGQVPYRFAATATTETAVAVYTPSIPADGLYPVYAWAAHGANRTRQLYRIRHSGGETQVRVPHQQVGKGWVYLGTYAFARGADPERGSVQISNVIEAGSPAGVVIADAIRFGNGMGDVDRGGGVSTYPREEECSRYWVQRMLGVGQSATLYDGGGDDASDNVGAPARMAAEMNRSESGRATQRAYVGFHSNAGGGRGVVGLYNNETLFPGTGTPNQVTLARLLAREINDDLVALGPSLETPWHDRGSNLTYARSDYAFGEIRGDALANEMDATIVEVAFHDDASDAKLLRDPKVRLACARATYQGLLRYFAQFDGAPLVFLPEPPSEPRAVAVAGGVRVSWSAPVAQGGSGAATGYLVYRSTDGRGFGDPVGTTQTSLLLTDLPANQAVYFRVTATNSGGESLPSYTVGCRTTEDAARSRVLFVNGFTRFERALNLRQDLVARRWRPPGHDANSGAADRVLPRRVNSFDYVVPHGEAMAGLGMPFDSGQRSHVAAGTTRLTDYDIVIWAAGNQSTGGRTFTPAEQAAVTGFLAAGGNLFVSGAEIAWDLDRDSGPSAADRAFLRTRLHARLAGNANDDAGTDRVTPEAGSIFAGSGGALFDDGSRGLYWVGYPDVLTPADAATTVALRYAGGRGGAAALVHPGDGAGGRVVYFGFPFETLTEAATRRAYLEDALRFLSRPVRLEMAAGAESDADEVRLVLQGEPGLSYAIEESGRGEIWTDWRRVTVDGSGEARVAVPVAPGEARWYRARLDP